MQRKASLRALIAALVIAVLSGCQTVPQEEPLSLDELRTQFGGSGGGSE